MVYRQGRKTAYKGVHGARGYIYGVTAAAFFVFGKFRKKDLTRTAKSDIIYKNGQSAPLCLFLGAVHKTLSL